MPESLFSAAHVIKIKYHGAIKDHPEYRVKAIEQGDWIDLRSAEDVYMKAGETRTISLGVSMELPDGYEAILAPRSSMLKKIGIVGMIGIIDNAYKGDNDIWCSQVYATTDTHIEVGDRIAQFRIQKKMDSIYFEEVDTLGNPDRGGFGTTGRK